MKILLGLILLLVLALTAAPRLRGRVPFLRSFILVGGEFFLLGWLLGDQGIGLLDFQTISALQPLLILGLGWVGLLIGLQFEWQVLKRIPRSFFGLGIGQGIFTFGLLYALCLPILIRFFGNGPDTQAATLFLAAAGSDSSRHILDISRREVKQHPHVPVHLFQFSAEMDTLIPIFALALLTGFQQEQNVLQVVDFKWSSTILWLGRGLVLGGALGVLLAFLLHRLRNPAHHLLILMGFLAFSGGVASSLGFSPLFINFVAGLVTVNMVGHRRDTWRLVTSSERPFYFIFLLLVGASWHIGSPWALIFAPLFFILRIVARFGATSLVSRMFPGRTHLGMSTALSLSGQGGVAVAMVAGFQALTRGTMADSIYTVILTSFLLSALIAPPLARFALGKGVKP